MDRDLDVFMGMMFQVTAEKKGKDELAVKLQGILQKLEMQSEAVREVEKEFERTRCVSARQSLLPAAPTHHPYRSPDACDCQEM